MDQITARFLNAINKKFYEQIATEFDATRQFPWQGWKRILPCIHDIANSNKRLQILDIGCGNGRFLHFLTQNNPDTFEYLGVDANEKLLDQARKSTTILDVHKMFVQTDIIAQLLNKQLVFNQTFDVICMFGFWHHIPGIELRQYFLMQLKNFLTDQGCIIFTAWQYQLDKRLANRAIDNSKIDRQILNQLEKGDMLLDWTTSDPEKDNPIRYCHQSDLEEIEFLTKNSNLQIFDKYTDDGKNQNKNQYYILKHRH